MTENEQESTVVEPKKRQYNRKPTPPPPPSPPSAAVMALESDVLALVRQRTTVNQEIAAAFIAANEANGRVQGAQMRLKQIEAEVQYQLSLIAQMKGQSQTQIYGPSQNDLHAPPNYENGFGVSIPPGVGSIPNTGPQRVVQSGPRVRSESAEGFRDEAIGVRAAI